MTNVEFFHCFVLFWNKKYKNRRCLAIHKSSLDKNFFLFLHALCSLKNITADKVLFINNCRAELLKNGADYRLLKNVIQSAVINLWGTRPVGAFLFKGQWWEWKISPADVPLVPGFCLHFHYNSTILSDAYILSSISWLAFNLLTHSQLSRPAALLHAGNQRGVILQRMNQGKMKWTPDTFRWF